MGKWDRELIELLPPGVKVSASAGAGYDWVDVGCLAEHGMLHLYPSEAFLFQLLQAHPRNLYLNMKC